MADTDQTMDNLPEGSADDPSGAQDNAGTLAAVDWSAAGSSEGQAIVEDTEVAQDEEAGPTTGREARYRTQLRAAEAENTRLADLVDGMRSAELERLATGELADPSDLFLDGGKVTDLLDDQGRVDPGKVDQFIKKLVSRHPHWRAPLVPCGGPLHSGSTNSRRVDTPAKGFSSAFAPKTE